MTFVLVTGHLSLVLTVSAVVVGAAVVVVGAAEVVVGADRKSTRLNSSH